MVQDTVTAEFYRADHLLEGHRIRTRTHTLFMTHPFTNAPMPHDTQDVWAR